ncbi:MAG: ABC transporter [Clostridiales bacterium]|nr:MAG: ABC transporter [Clostridiales bacterium]
MILAEKLTKSFGKKEVLKNLCCSIDSGCIYGLVGANGAGKSTFLRLLTGVYKPNEGTVEIDNSNVFDNAKVKQKFCFVADELYFPTGATVRSIGKMYKTFYPTFSQSYFNEKCALLNLPLNGKLTTFSKGMKRQVSMIGALSTMCEYLFFDETFDGLDPVVRNLMKRLICDAVAQRGATVVLTSHNLRELEDICDHLGVLFKGGILFEGDVNNIKTGVCKVQVAFTEPIENLDLSGLEIMNKTTQGSVSTLVVKGDIETTTEYLKKFSPVLLEVVGLTLEEVFIYEMEVLGYAFPELGI